MVSGRSRRPSFVTREPSSGAIGGRPRLKRMATLGVLHSGRDITKPRHMFYFVNGTRKVFYEAWSKITADGIKPGLLDVLAYFRWISTVKSSWASTRDKQYRKDGTQAQSPREVIKQGGILDALFFATLAYCVSDKKKLEAELKKHGFELLCRTYDGAIGGASYYIALSEEKKIVYVAIKGSNTIADFILNFCGRSTPYYLDDYFVEGGESTKMLWSHEAMTLVAAQQICNNIELLVKSFIIPSGYSIIFTGHSLGACLACLSSIILRSMLRKRFPDIVSDNGDILKCIAFAPAPCVEKEVAMVCKPFITSVVNNSDIVPRFTIHTMFFWVAKVKIIKKKLNELGVNSISNLWLYTKLMWLKEPFLSYEEMTNAMPSAMSDVDKLGLDDMMIPGKVIVLYDRWSKPGYDPISITNGKDVRTADGMLLCDGSAMVLRNAVSDCRMLFDHKPECYLSSLRSVSMPLAQDHQDFSKLS